MFEKVSQSLKYNSIDPQTYIYIHIRECTLYVGLQHAVPPTNTIFQPLRLLSQAGTPYTNTHKDRTSYVFQVYTHISASSKRWKSISATRQKPEILAVLHHQYTCNNNNKFNFKIFSLNSDEIFRAP